MDGLVFINVLDVSGKWYIINLVEFKLLNRSDFRIEKFVVFFLNGLICRLRILLVKFIVFGWNFLLM